MVILTAFSQRDLVERARDAGAMAYLVKPFSKADLVPAIEMAVIALRRAPSSSSPRSPTSASSWRPARLSTGPRACCSSSWALSEPEAFRWIQKTAMDLRLSMREVAEGVVDARIDCPNSR